MAKKFIRLFNRFSEPAPQLEGREWEEARNRIQTWAEKVVSILDSLTSVTIDTDVVVSPPGGGGAPPPIVIAPDPSELGFTARKPEPHLHRADEIADLPLNTGVRLAAESFASHRNVRSDEIVGLVGDTQVILAAQIFGP